MSLFPVHRPCLGLSFNRDAVGLAEIRRGSGWRWGTRGDPACSARLLTYREEPLPAGLLQPSEIERNIRDISALAGILRTVHGARRDVSVAVSLPDSCAHLALLEFETLPRKATERDSLIRWQLEQDCGVSLKDAQLTYRMFSSPGSGRSRPTPTRVLTVGIQRSILQQYTLACENAGLIPVQVGLSSLQVFDFCRSSMGMAVDHFFVHQTAEGFFFMAFQHGIPSFLRFKSGASGSVPTLVHTAGTLQYYNDQRVDRDEIDEDVVRPLYVVMPEVPGRDFSAADALHTPSDSLQEGSGLERLGVQVFPLDWDHLPVRTPRGVTPRGLTLQALAGAVVG